MKPIKNKRFRILPIVIFMSVLMLTLRINNVVDNIKQRGSNSFSLSSNQAQAEEQSGNTTAELNKILEGASETTTKNDTTVNNGKSFSQSEIAILQELAERREALDLRSKEIDKKAVQLKVTEEEIGKKLAQLQNYEKRLRALMKEYTAKEKEKLDSLVKVYTSMKPKDAARIFNTLDLEITTALVREMKPSASSAIISQMEASKAKAITDALIGNSLNNSGLEGE